jgi:hypothetical protein
MRESLTRRNGLAGAILVLGSTIGAAAEPPIDADPLFGLRNESPGFLVRVEVDHPNRIYADGEALTAFVTSERDGYLYLLYRDAHGGLKCVFPNRHQDSNKICAKVTVSVPGDDARFQLTVGEPFGIEILKAVVTREPVGLEELGMPQLVKSIATPISGETLKALYVRLKPKPAEWAEHEVEIRTVRAKGLTPAAAPRRVALVVGIGEFADPNIRNLQAGEGDAKAVAAVLQQQCKVDDVIALTNAQATRENIERAIGQRLRDITQPGDAVILYFSTHGGRCADQDGDEQDGLDEYLVPYDGRFGDLADIRRTMLLDDRLGRRLLDLDGRRIVLLLDMCHSAGLSTFEKGLGQPPPVPKAAQEFLDFLVGSEVSRAKDIGTRQTAMLCSATASQWAFERRDLAQSVMTHFLVKFLKDATKSVTLKEAAEYVRGQVPNYVRANFGNAEQTPVFISDLTEDVVLRP